MIRINADTVSDVGVTWDLRYPGAEVDQVGYIVYTGRHIQQNIKECCKTCNKIEQISSWLLMKYFV